MQSKEKKIKKLIDSEDPSNHNLGQLAILSSVCKENVLYWYLELEQKKDIMKFNSDLEIKMTDLLGWHPSKPAMEHLSKMVEFIQTYCPSQSSIEKFFAYYNEYLFSLMSHSWTTEIRKSVKSQIPQLNVSTTPTEPYEDL